MFIAFNFNELKNFKAIISSGVSQTSYRLRGKNLFEADKVKIKDTIEKYYLESGQTLLDGNKIMEEWFPLVESDIFISHSHADIEEIHELVGFLNIEFGIKAFIDSAVWGYADELLKMIDDKHCKNKKLDTYNYNKRNITTSNVYLMLINSLQNMIDNTECVIFVQTPNSVKKITEQFEDSTYSPWIFSELNIVEKIRIKKPIRNYKYKVHMNFEKRAEDNEEVLLENVQVVYKIDEQISKLEKLSNDDIMKWKRMKVNNPSAQKNLDRLYLLKEVFVSE
ncbi:hypothetical protein [Lysinibacillus sp. NPDC086135]|uniref:hypothetical protein n=1 Tax=Lysinibacillus sp. NPDC086135 TaxID=3364130 RepID=UPI00381ECC65